nr:unnamed protein product [Callosobruchus analis]
MDNYWGGKNDITAAMGFEKDGVTTILFRRKLEAKEPSDHTIEEDFMHVIFAQGQEPGKYVHVPKSGVESGQASIKDFYKLDELKYHGHKQQRGVVSLNFFEEKRMVEPAGAAANSPNSENTDCGGIWKVPKNCNPDNYTCEYSAKWELIPRKDTIKFTITTKHTDTWTGIGFSNNERMSQTDAILGWVDKTGRSFLMDTWILGYQPPLLDPTQNIFNTSGKVVNGVTTLTFSRKRSSTDTKDLSFTDDQCLFMMFPVKGGAFNSVNKKIRKHEVVPAVSTERICIRSCGNDEDYDEYLTTTEAPGIAYSVEVKLVELGENFKLPKAGSLQYTDLTNSIEENFKPLFNKLPGYRRVVVENIKPDDRNLVAAMNLQLERPLADKARALAEDTSAMDEKVKRVVRESISSGRIGNLKVDPQYLVIEPQKFNSFECTYILTSTMFVPQDHLIPNSAWKDYSSNTNYAFDAFEAEEKKHQQHPQNHQMNGKSKNHQERPERNHERQEPAPKARERLQRPTAKPPSVPNQTPGDTRSLQRPRGAYPSTTMERATFSLPRTAYDRNHRNAHDLQPDFYFMPSQRKYSGEVVRVYVDYNNQPK